MIFVNRKEDFTYMKTLILMKKLDSLQSIGVKASMIVDMMKMRMH